MSLKMTSDIKELHQNVYLDAIVAKMFQQKAVNNPRKDNC